MRYPILFLFLALFMPLTNVVALPALPGGEECLETALTNRFAPLTQLSLQSLPGYKTQLIPYLKARGVEDEGAMEALVSQDLFHFAHALSILFEKDPTSTLHSLLGEHFSLVEGLSIKIDHVGRELFGPLSFYLPLLGSMAPRLGLIHLQDIVFPSTQVVNILREQDPRLQGVTIGRVYFQCIESRRIKCLELFQTSPQDEEAPQHIDATKQRIFLLTESASHAMISPIDHVSIELNSLEEVERIHKRIHELTSETLLPYQKEISHNPGDGSFETKALMRESSTAPFSRIVEFAYYSKKAVKGI